MRTIWKFALEVTGVPQVFDVPRGAKVVRVAEQNGKVAMWVDVDTKRPVDERTYQIFGTGHTVPEDAIYMGSADMKPFVWHVFEAAR